MALSYKAVQMGFSTTLTRTMLLDAVTGITAAGTSQATATHVDNSSALIETTPAFGSGAGIRLSVNAVGGDSQQIYNGGTQPMLVYPPVGHAFQNLPVNTAFTLVSESLANCYCLGVRQSNGITTWAVNYG